MRIPALTGAVINLLVVILLSGNAGAGQCGSVGWVADGDTFVLTNGQTVRLAAIDAPEIGRDGKPSQFHAEASRRTLHTLVRNRRVCLEPAGTGRDRYGRVLAYVKLEDGRMLNEVLVAKGAAFFYPHAGESGVHVEKMLAAQHEAIAKEKGFWRRMLHSKGGSTIYLGNRSSRRFHTLECSNGRRMAGRNKIYFNSLKEAFLEGYAPARGCTVWPRE